MGLPLPLAGVVADGDGSRAEGRWWEGHGDVLGPGAGGDGGGLEGAAPLGLIGGGSGAVNNTTWEHRILQDLAQVYIWAMCFIRGVYPCMKCSASPVSKVFLPLLLCVGVCA